MQGCGNQEWLPAETKSQGLAGWQSWGGPAGGAGSMGVLIAQRHRADVMSVRRCWHHPWKVSWKIEQGDVEMENQRPSSGRWDWQVPHRRQPFAWPVDLPSSAHLPPSHSGISSLEEVAGSVRWGERREGSGQELWRGQGHRLTSSQSCLFFLFKTTSKFLWYASWHLLTHFWVLG